MIKRNNFRTAVILMAIMFAALLISTLAACDNYEADDLDISRYTDTTVPETMPEVDVEPSTSVETVPETPIPNTSTSSEPIPEANAPDDITTPQYSEEDKFWEYAKDQYPIATEIWLIMKSYGWTDATCAGIMGNIMRECGGDSLKYINPNLYNSTNTHYGLIQWSKRYYPDIQPTATWTPSVEEQLTYLRYTIINQKSLHHNYGFTEDYLLTATSYKEVAKAFCEGYERPNDVSTRRERNAEAAWEYFVLRTSYSS